MGGQKSGTSTNASPSRYFSIDPSRRFQATIGNQAVQALLQTRSSFLTFQAKLEISQPNDAYEVEADRVADEVMQMPGSVIQRTCASCAENGTTCHACEETTGVIQREIEHPVEITNVPDHFLANSGNGRPLDDDTRLFMESRFGHDFGDVKIHTDQQADESAKSINARAYTVGQNIVFGSAEYSPHTNGGRFLLAHELTHVVQQSAGINPPSLQRQAREKTGCDPTNLGTLGPMFKKPESEVSTLGLPERKLHSAVETGEQDFVLYCPHRASIPLRHLIPASTVYFIGTGKAAGKDEVWAHQEGETDMFWGFIKNTKYAPEGCEGFCEPVSRDQAKWKRSLKGLLVIDAGGEGRHSGENANNLNQQCNVSTPCNPSPLGSTIPNLVCGNLSRPWPIEDHQADVIYSENSPINASEMARVIKNGGKISIFTPETMMATALPKVLIALHMAPDSVKPRNETMCGMDGQRAEIVAP